MSQASDAARARVAEMGNLDPLPITPAIEPAPVYPAPDLDDPNVTLEPRLTLLHIQAATEPPPETP
jgi:hypothetical protein